MSLFDPLGPEERAQGIRACRRTEPRYGFLNRTTWVPFA